MITIFIEGQPYEVEEGENLLRIALSLGFDLPYFCWHPVLHSVGACRQCAIKQFKNEEDTRGRIVMACMTPASAGMRISINDPEARQFRRSVIEFLMVNHPHDCPVCDEGGECHLQDMTVMTGHAKREFRFLKRTHRNQYLGPFVTHEMNRCIACYRCVRYYRNYAGGSDLNVFGAHDHVYFGRQSDGVLESEFSGNLVEVCPTGVFTDKTLAEHYSRKWDLQTAPSVCVHCSVGCNTIPGERYGKLRRVHNRYNHQVNGCFLCDRGRYGYEFVNSSQRIGRPLIRGAAASGPEAMQLIQSWIADPSKVIGIGSPRASLESNFALRELVGAEKFYQGVSEVDFHLTSAALGILRQGSVSAASLREVEQSDAVLVLGEDVVNTAPMLALALRQASRVEPMKKALKLKIPPWHDSALREVMQDKRGPVFVATPAATRLDDAAVECWRAAPADIAGFGFAVAHAIDPQAPEPPNLSPQTMQLVARVAEALLKAEHPLVVCGTSSRSLDMVYAAANVAWALQGQKHDAKICLALPECNSMGLALMGGQDLNRAFQEVRDKKVETAIILENDLFRCVEANVVEAFLRSVKHILVLDHVSHQTSAKAEVVLPAAPFAESTGTLVNYEGRAQRFYEVYVPGAEVNSSWRWLAQAQGASWPTEDDVVRALGEAIPVFAGVSGVAPPENFRVAGCKIARQPHRYSGRTATNANISVQEPKPPPDPNSPLAYSMEGYEGGFPSPLIVRYWQPGWNSVQSLNKFQTEIDGPIKAGNPGLRLIGAKVSGGEENQTAGMGGEGSSTSSEGNVAAPGNGRTPEYFSQLPAPFVRGEGEWLVVPLYHIFGSEELSLLAPGIAQLAPKPYLALGAEDARRLELQERELAVLTINGSSHRLPVTVLATLPDGVAGLPCNLPGIPFVSLPFWSRISKAPANP